MKKVLSVSLISMLLLAMSTIFMGQGFNAFQKTTFTSVTTATRIRENTTIGFHQLAWSGASAACTVSLDSSVDGTVWVVGGIIAGQNCNAASPSAVTAGTANWVRVNVTVLAAGSVTVSYTGWTSNPTGGGGTGTVTNTGGALVLNKVMLGAGVNDSKTSTTATDDGTTLTYTGTGGVLSTTAGGLKAGANGGAAGVVSLLGSTSGTATFTAPAAAGTATNQVVMSNNLQAPVGDTTHASFGLGNANTGLASSGSSPIVISGGTQITQFTTTSLRPLKPLDLTGSGSTFFVTSNFTTAANTNLQTITGLSYTAITANATNTHFHCSLAYSQATGTAAVAFGIQAATNNPTNIFATGKMYTAAGTVTTGVLATLATTTATSIVSGTPGGIGVNLPVELDGTLQLVNSANTINFMVSTATSGDAVTVLQGSYCMVF